MEISDNEVFKSMQKMAAMEPTVKRVAEFIDNGELDIRIKVAVAAGIKECPFYIEGKVTRRVKSFGRWFMTVTIPAAIALLTIYFTVGFK